MPGSSPHGKAWIAAQLAREAPSRVLDIGPGCGTYSDLFRARWPGSHWTAVEVWEPYVEQWKLREKYDAVHVADARTWAIDGRYDVAFLGDVLEHMTQDEACALLARVREVAGITVVSIPIVHYPQGAIGGNPHETHVEEDWSHERVVAVFGKPTAFVNDQEIGAYIYRATDSARPMKVAVYAIAKNEAANAERWAGCAREADYLVVADTGSTDGTQEKLRALGVTVFDIHVEPWRFDVPRNVALTMIPSEADYCIALDLDEILLPGWRSHLEEAHRNGWTRPRYRYVWSWRGDGTPDLVYHGDKIHARAGYRWHHPVHEVASPYILPETGGHIGLEIHHHPDSSRSARDYLPLLELAVKEDPNDDRNAHYYARELFFRKLFPEAIAEFKRHLALPTAKWQPERAASMRYLAKCEPAKRTEWLWKATEECPTAREAWVELAEAYHKQKAWAHCHAAALAALQIKDRALVYLEEARAWGSLPWDLAAVSAYHLGHFEDAVQYGERAVELDPGVERLALNLALYRRSTLGPPCPE